MCSCIRTCSLLLYCVCVCVIEGVAVSGWSCPQHTDMQQLANKDEFCCVWQRFSVHYFPLCPARIPDLSSCLSCKDTLSGPDSSSHAHTQYAWLIHTSLALAPPTHSPTYVGNICSDLSHYHSTPCTLRGFPIPSSSLISHLVSNQSPCSFVLPLIRLSSATCLLSHLTFIRKALIPGRRSLSGFPRSEVSLGSYSQTWHLKQASSYLGCGQFVCWPVSCFGEHVDIKRL